MQANDFTTNVLLLGKTGVGKSSLLNYLFGENVAETGAGSAVTPRGIYEHRPFQHNGMRIRLYDSWGLEPDKDDSWVGLITKELEKHDTKRIEDWFHTIIYCVDAKRTRIDDFEKKIMDQLFNAGNRMVFALTRADAASPEELAAVQNELSKRYADSIRVPVCSVGQKLLTGEVTEQAGKAALIEAICRNLSENLFGKALTMYERNLESSLMEATKKIMETFELKAGPLGIFTNYGDEFRREMIAEINDRYKNAVNRSRYGLLDLLEEIIALETRAIEKFSPEYAKRRERINLDLIYENISILSGTNWETLLKFILPHIEVSIYPVLLSLFFRKSKNRRIFQNRCNMIVDSVRSKHGTHIANMRKRSIEDENFMVSSLAIRR